MDLAKLKHGDKCCWWDANEFCDCGADTYEELQEAKKTIQRPTQLCEKQGREIQERKDQQYERHLQWRGIDIEYGDACVCKGRTGSGIRAYSNTTTWRGGIGGQAITADVCDKCWGSGDSNHTWADLRKMQSALIRHAEEKALMAVQMAGLDAELSVARQSVERLAAERNLFRKETVALAKDALQFKAVLKEVSGCHADHGTPKLCDGCLILIEGALADDAKEVK